MRQTESPSAFASRGTQIRNLLIALLAGLLIGFVPMWLRARQRTSERDQALHDLQKSELQNQLSAAALDSRRGEYEPAREELSRFFASLNGEFNRKNDSDLSSEQLKLLPPMFAQRDELITLLARSDPASADRLSKLDVVFRRALAER